MAPSQPKNNTINLEHRIHLRVVVPDDHAKATAKWLEPLIGRRPKVCFKFIQAHAGQVEEVEELDV